MTHQLAKLTNVLVSSLRSVEVLIADLLRWFPFSVETVMDVLSMALRFVFFSRNVNVPAQSKTAGVSTALFSVSMSVQPLRNQSLDVSVSISDRNKLSSTCQSLADINFKAMRQ